MGGELAAVADAEYGHAEFKNFGVHFGAAAIIYAVGAAREDYAYGGVFFYFFNSHVARHEVAVNVLLAHAPCNKLVVLTAEVEYQNSFALHNLVLYVIFLRRNPPFCGPMDR